MRNPYVGPKWFEEEDKEYFFGRDQEARDLLAQVVSERLVLFYAQSGAGKSSLLRARLIPSLRAQGFEVLPIGRVSGELPAEIQSDRVSNIFSFNLILSLNSAQGAESLPATQLVATTLADFLAGEPEAAAVSAAANPDAAEAEATDYLPTVLIIDQFEELLTTHLHRWQERSGFFTQLRQVLDRFHNLWVVLTLREDYIAGLGPYAHLLSNRLSTRYYMQRLGIDAALAAVQRPAAEKGQRPFAPGVAEALVNNLRRIKVIGQAGGQLGQYVEPVQLQVVCYQLWENLHEAATAVASPPVEAAQSPTTSTTPTHISEADLKRLAKGGDLAKFVDEALGDYYERALSKVCEADAQLSERQVRDWFSSQLITKAGTRGFVPQEGEQAGGLALVLVRLLQDQFLIRAEDRAGGRWFELTHDRFVEPVLEANRAWLLKQSNPVTVAMRLWQNNPQDSTRLLRGPQLADAQRYAQQHPAELGKEEQEFLDLCQKTAATEAETARQQQLAEAQKMAEAQQQRAATFRRFAFGLAVLALLALAATGFAFVQQRNASQQATLAQTEETKAIRAQQAAEQNAAAAATAEARTQALSQQIRADQIAQKASLANIDTTLTQYPQRALLLAIEAVRIVTPPVRSSLTTLYNLLGRTGGVGFSGHADGVTSVAFSPDGQTLASGSADNTIRLWSLAEPAAEPVVLHGHANSVNSIAFASDGQTLASGSDDGTIHLWSLADPAADPVVLTGHADSVWSVAFAPDGKTLASGSWDHTIRLWSLDEPAADPVVLTDHEHYVTSVAFAPDGKTLASGSWDHTIRLWSLDEPAADPVVLTGHENSVTSVAFAPDGKTLASGSWDHTIRLWSLSEPAADPVVLTGHTDDVMSVAFAPDGKTLASGSLDHTIRLWSLSEPTADPVVLTGHTDAVTSLAFAPDGKTLASGSRDKTIRLWSLGEPTADPVVLTGHEDAIMSVAFAPDGKTLASGSVDKIIRLWQLTQETLLALACRVAGRNLSSEEWQQYFAESEYQRTCYNQPIHPSILQPINELARTGEITKAVAAYQKLLEFDPTLLISPSIEANRQYALTVVEQANQLAVQGEITKALASYQQALKLDPTLPIMPAVEANRRYAPTVVKQANQLASQGEITKAVASYQQALVLDSALDIDATLLVEAANRIALSGDITLAVAGYQQALVLDPTLPITPIVEANRRYAPTVVEQANQLASQGEITKAMASYQQALKLDPTLPIMPAVEANRQYASTVLNKANDLARQGEITASLAAISQTLQLDPNLSIQPATWSSICWHGSLVGLVNRVLFACEKAVAAAPDDGSAHNGRGLARTLLGDTKGAIADFKVCASVANLLAASFLDGDPNLQWCEMWVRRLEAGEDPQQIFSRTTLEALRTGQALPAVAATPIPVAPISPLAPPVSAPLSPLATPRPTAPASPLPTPVATATKIR